MRKLLSVLLMLALVSALLVPAMAELNVTGDWYLKIMKMGDEEYDAASIGYVMTMTLKEDGTVSMTTAGVDEVSTGTWTL